MKPYGKTGVTDGEEVPEIFILLISYFEIYPQLLKTEGLFRIAASLDKIDEMQVHLTMGNYSYLHSLSSEPHVISNFLKKVLKNMGEPLCTFNLYGRFRDLEDTKDKTLKLAKLKEICGNLPEINRNVFIFIIKFFRKVIVNHEQNRMNIHNLATVVTPNLFRPFELTPNDLIFAGHLVKTFKLMIKKYPEIFNMARDLETEMEEEYLIDP